MQGNSIVTIKPQCPDNTNPSTRHGGPEGTESRTSLEKEVEVGLEIKNGGCRGFGGQFPPVNVTTCPFTLEDGENPTFLLFYFCQNLKHLGV